MQIIHNAHKLYKYSVNDKYKFQIINLKIGLNGMLIISYIILYIHQFYSISIINFFKGSSIFNIYIMKIIYINDYTIIVMIIIR